ncbi:MAG: hypothetical protein ACLR4Z_14670 [Butyricicoccaceae bacterium]
MREARAAKAAERAAAKEAAEKNGETAEKAPKEAKKPAAKKKTVKKTLPWMTKTTNKFKKLKDEAAGADCKAAGAVRKGARKI